MIWLLFGLLIAVTLIPLLPTLRPPRAARDARDATLTAARAERAELEREIADGRIDPAQIADARLEADRRLLAADRIARNPIAAGSRSLVAGLAAVAIAGGGTLYAAAGRPLLPASHAEGRAASVAEEAQASAMLIMAIEAKLQGRDASDPQAWQGYVYLGDLHADRAEWADAARAWSVALASRFDPLIAARAADAEATAAGRLTPHAKALFEQALAQAPEGAPWAALIRERLNGS